MSLFLESAPAATRLGAATQYPLGEMKDLLPGMLRLEAGSRGGHDSRHVAFALGDK